MFQPCNARNVTLGSLISRPLPVVSSLPVACYCDLGDLGVLELRQADSLARIEFSGSLVQQSPDAAIAFVAHASEEPANRHGLKDAGFVFTLFGPLSVAGKFAVVSTKEQKRCVSKAEFK
jgi:hypothetical protein